jgi:hypothetical protein
MKELLHEVPDFGDLNADYAPKQIKLARSLRARIQRGDFSNGQYLSRIQLAAEYDVSRIRPFTRCRHLPPVAM